MLKKKKFWIILTAVLTVLSAAFTALFTVPVIDKVDLDYYQGLEYVGGEFSHANVQYTDYRPILADKEKPADVWVGMNNEWRRLEGRYYDGGTFTVRVLRDKAFAGSRFGISRSEAKPAQEKYEQIVADYNNQSIFDRVWIWDVREFH